MEANKILDSNILDIIFDGKNKNYGAYNLRQNYNRRLETSMVITFSAILIVAILFVISKPEQNVLPKKIFDVIDTRLAVLKPEVITTKQSTSVKTKSSQKIKPQIPVIIKDDLFIEKEIDKNLLVFNGLDGNKNEGNNENAGKQGIDTSNINMGNVTGTNTETEIKYSRLDKEEIEAEFPGGINAWRKYLERYLDANIPIDNGAPAGTYTVIVSFNVSTTGEISEVKAETDFGFGMEREAVRAIKKGPHWKPGIQNGKFVKSMRKQPITFIVINN